MKYQDAINQLHFHPKWFDYGLLETNFFAQQVEKYQHEKETFGDSLEHYRYFAFKSVLSSRESLSNEELEQYIELCQLDEDRLMAHAALIDLLLWQELTDKQYQKLTTHPAFSGKVAQKIIWRNQMRCKLSSGSISNEVFTHILEREDRVLQRELVSSPSISRNQLEVLAENGINRAVRNMAKNILRRRLRSTTNERRAVSS
jgi:hypothetical protein